MSWMDKLLSYINIEKYTITLHGEEREGGYMFISSPELKGFSLMLEPANYDDFKTFIDAVYDPLTAYMEAYHQAHKTARSDHLRLRSTRMNEDGMMVAKMCFQ